ncbi:putative histidine kinase 3 [Carex rostrata]
MTWFIDAGIMEQTPRFLNQIKLNFSLVGPEKLSLKSWRTHLYNHYFAPRKVRETWWQKLLILWVVLWFVVSLWILWFMNSAQVEKRRETLGNMCDERARMLQDQFNVSMNHLQALAILVSTFHHAKNPSAIDQATFARYAERTTFERPVTSGVAYAVKVLHSEREQFEKMQGWTIKKMYSSKKSMARNQGGDGPTEVMPQESCPVADEYAPVIFAQDKYKHVVSLDMLSGHEDRENILRARASGKGVLTAPFPLVKSNLLGVILTYAVYKSELPSNATPDERIEAAIGYLGGIFDIEALVDKLLHQLACKQSISVNVYDTTNGQVRMYGPNKTGTGVFHNSALNFGNPIRKHEMHCRYLIALVSLINEVLDQAKIESGKLELEAVYFNLRSLLDDTLSLFSGKAQEKGLELGVYVSDQVPETLVGDLGRIRQIITNFMGNSIKFTDRGHIYLTVHLIDEVASLLEVETETDPHSSTNNTLSGHAVAARSQSWKNFSIFQNGSNPFDGPYISSCSNQITLIISVEDTGVGIPYDAQSRVFTPFMQVRPSVTRIHGGTGIGLSISKCLVGLMKGEIGFASRPHIGSTFTFTAVLTRTHNNSTSSEYKPTEFHGMNALIVDNRPVRAQVTSYNLHRLGIKTELIPNLSQFLPKLRLNMVLIDKETWSLETKTWPSFASRFTNGTTPKVFILANPTLKSNSPSFRDVNLNIILKPLRASMLQVSLQRSLLGGGDRENCRNRVVGNLSLGSLLQGKRILVVDDNLVNLRVAAGALKKYRAEVTCAGSGKQAIAYLSLPHTFDACFMDIQMPEMDGFEATRRIRAMEEDLNDRIKHGETPPEINGKVIQNWHIPILAMTADVIQATHEKSLKSGMDGYVSKPFEGEQVYREVARFFKPDTKLN